MGRRTSRKADLRIRVRVMDKKNEERIGHQSTQTPLGGNHTRGFENNILSSQPITFSDESVLFLDFDVLQICKNITVSL